MSFSSRIIVLFVLGALTLAIAGCGGGSSSNATGGDPTASSTGSESSNAAETVSGEAAKHAFIEEADVICEAADTAQEKTLAAFTKKHPKAETEKGAAGKLRLKIGLPPVVEEAEELGELTPPEGDEAAYGEIVSGIEQGIEGAEAEAEATATGKAKPFAAVEKKAAAYGFAACARPL